MYSFPNLEPVCCSRSSSNCCFLSCIQVSQETSKLVWYSHLLKNFLQCVVIHTVKGFRIVNAAEVDVFLEFLCFFYNPTDVGNLVSGSSTFSKSCLYIWKFSVHVLLNPHLYILSSTLVGTWKEGNCPVVWTFFGIALLWDWMKTDLFQFCGNCCVFKVCWHLECSTLVALSFRIWNSSAGIPSPPLALFTVMLPKAHLTSHSRMSGCRWVTTPSQLSESLRPFCIFLLYFCHFFLISSASVRSLLLLSFIVPTLVWNFPLVSSTPLYWYTIFCFSSHLLMQIWVVSTFCFLWRVPLWSFVHKVHT